jgi:NADPH:quinone reductase-like Zn-dependent oxidoreductase
LENVEAGRIRFPDLNPDGLKIRIRSKLNHFGLQNLNAMFLGHEIAGVVSDVGANVQDLHVGDRYRPLSAEHLRHT